MNQLSIQEVETTPYADQRPGTAGLRKKVATFRQANYMQNFVQSIFDVLELPAGATLVLGGDGRFYNKQAISIIAAMAAANNIGKLIIGRGGILSTPAASNLIRKRKADGGILLTASHNPGGPEGDFGIKFNTASGGQAPEQMTDAVFARSQKIDRYLIAELPDLDLMQTGRQKFGSLELEIVDPVDDYAELMEELFDFELIRHMLKKRMTMHFDALHAVTGPYAQRIFCEMLGVPAACVSNAIPLEDFGGGHPDPNPVDAPHLLDLAMSSNSPDLIGASDGDGDRNMILGRNMVVSPGDSLAIIAANAQVAPGYRQPLKGIARSMPTSRATDMVANELGIDLYETPTGWRYFCNLLEAGRIDLCGEESFGTSSSHTREKDGIWAVLFWLNMMAALEQSVDEIVHNHWRRFGRCFFQRRDYFIPDAAAANALMEDLFNNAAGLSDRLEAVESADVFNYTDPVDQSESHNQGVRVHLKNGGRAVFRLSGTGTAGATLRVYLDKPDPDPANFSLSPAEALGELAASAAEIAAIERHTGLTEPTAIIG